MMTPASHENRRLAIADPTIPWYISIVYKLGVPSAIAIYLVWRLTSGLPTSTDVAQVKTLLDTHVTATESKLVEMQMLLRAICYNTAPDERYARGCNLPTGK